MRSALIIFSISFSLRAQIVFSQPAFLPSDIPGLQLWLLGDSGVISDGLNRVSQWTDYSGNNRHAVQADTLKMPLLLSSEQKINFLPVLKFDGIDDYMDFSQIGNMRSIFLVVKHNTGNQSGAPILGDPSDYYFFAGSSTIFGGSASLNILNGQSFLNGNSVAPSLLSKPIEYAVISILTLGNVSASYITNDRFSPNGIWDGTYAELIIYDTLLDSIDRGSIEQYLFDKYAPAIYLGADTILNNSFCNISINAGNYFDNYSWSNGDTTPAISVSQSGQYHVTVIDIFGRTCSDTINVTINRPFYTLQSDTLVCGNQLAWNTGLDNSFTFLWQDSSTDSLLTINQTGTYWVNVFDPLGCVLTDSAFVAIDSFPKTASLGPDTALCSGASIGLVSGASQATSYVWSTGATTSSIVITTTGVYSVIAQNGNGCVVYDTINLNVKGVVPAVGFLSPAICFGNPFLFTDSTFIPSPDSIAAWAWNFGDASIDSVQNPVHTYTSSGTYTVTLSVVSDSGCSAVIQKPVTVNAKPIANFSIASSPVCSSAVAQFLDASSISSGSLSAWHWDFGVVPATNDISNQKNPTYTYSTAGTYSVMLIVTSNAGCKDTIINTVTVSPSPSAFFIATSVCQGNNTSFSDGSTGAQLYQWNFGDASNSTFQNPTHQYAAAGTYNVILFVTASNGCVNFYMDSVDVYHLPQTVFFGDSVCVNSGLQFTDASSVIGSTINAWNWNFPNGIPSSSTLQNPTVTYTATGTKYVSLTVTSAQGCFSTLTQTVNVLPLPAADFSFSPTFGTPPLTVNFSDLSSGGTAYQWYFGDGGQSVSPNPNYVYQNTGTFPILLISQSLFGCMDSVRDTILVDYPLLDIAVLSVSAFKSSNTIQVSALLKNTGTLDVTTIELSAYFDNGTPVHEFWIDTLKPYQPPFSYQFNSTLELVNDRHSIVCVEVKKVNGKNDDVISNNKQCTAITSEFTLLNPFPNPAMDEIYFLFVLPDASTVKAQIWDVRGRLVETLFDGGAAKGLNQITYNVSQLDKAIYVLKLSYKEKNITKMFMKE